MVRLTNATVHELFCRFQLVVFVIGVCIVSVVSRVGCMEFFFLRRNTADESSLGVVCSLMCIRVRCVVCGVWCVVCGEWCVV